MSLQGPQQLNRTDWPLPNPSDIHSSASTMTWQRHNGRLVRGSDNSACTLVALPQRTRRRRARPKPQPNRLTSLPDDIAKRVSAFVAPPARPAAALRVAATDSAFRNLVHRCCLEHLNTCTVDDVSHALELMRAYSRARAPLISLTVHLGSEELQMLRWLLETCDTTQLMRVRIVVPKNCPPFMNLLAHSLGRPSGPIDVDADTFRVPTMLDFNRIVAWRPDPTYRPVLRSLRSLALVGCGDEALAQMGSVLRHLVELQLTVPNRYRRGTKKYPALSRLTRLRYLALHGGTDTQVEIHSEHPSHQHGRSRQGFIHLPCRLSLAHRPASSRLFVRKRHSSRLCTAAGRIRTASKLETYCTRRAGNGKDG